MHETITYSGIADAHGLESFRQGTEGMGILALRASTNRQRHAVAYQVELNPTQAETIKQILQSTTNDRCISALITLKKFINLNGAPCKLAGGGNVAKSLELIPNPELDPWG